MAKRRKSRRRRSQLGYNADAKEAIKHARNGKCELAMRHLVDAGMHHSPDDRDAAHLARVIVNQHCGKVRTRKIKSVRTGKKQAYPYWGSRKRRKRSRR